MDRTPRHSADVNWTSIWQGRAAQLWERLPVILGGPARRRVVVLLACVLSLSAADSGTLGALAAQIEKSFRIGNTRLGLLATVTSLVGAPATLPMGVLADRTNRVRLLVIAIIVWAATMAVTGLAVNYLMLLTVRLAGGVVLATAGPVVASLVGDYFPSAERSRIYGFMPSHATSSRRSLRCYSATSPRSSAVQKRTSDPASTALIPESRPRWPTASG